MDRRFALGLAAVTALALRIGAVAVGQSGPDTVQGHVEAAKTAAGKDFPGLFGQLCTPPAPRPAVPQGTAAQPPPAPDRSVWHVQPAKVFDNLYFVGQSEYSAWAVTTSAGIILVDSIFGY